MHKSFGEILRMARCEFTSLNSFAMVAIAGALTALAAAPVMAGSLNASVADAVSARSDRSTSMRHGCCIGSGESYGEVEVGVGLRVMR
jgi:hypothetical protein